MAVERSRGWRLAKTKRSRKINLPVALGMAAESDTQEQSRPVGGTGGVLMGLLAFECLVILGMKVEDLIP